MTPHENEFAESFLQGRVLFVDKPLHWTSFDAVNKIKSLLRYRQGIKKDKGRACRNTGPPGYRPPYYMYRKGYKANRYVPGNGQNLYRSFCDWPNYSFL